MAVRLAGIPCLTGRPRRARIKRVKEIGNRGAAAIGIPWAIDNSRASVTAAAPTGGSRRESATAVPAREMPAIAVRARQRATEVQTAAGATASATVTCPVMVDPVATAPSAAEGPAETAHEPAAHVALRALAVDEAAADEAAAGVAVAADGGDLSHQSGGTHELKCT